MRLHLSGFCFCQEQSYQGELHSVILSSSLTHPFQGSSQKADEFYEDFEHYYKTVFSSKDYPQREPTSLWSKFKDIGAKCMKFSGYYRSARSLIEENAKKSGSTSWEHNQLALTHKLYIASEQAEFPYYECWLILKDQPKWSVDFTASLGAKSERSNSKMFQSPRSWSCGGSSRSNFSTPDDPGPKTPDLHMSPTFTSSRMSSTARHELLTDRPKIADIEFLHSAIDEGPSSFGTPPPAFGGVYPQGVQQALQSMHNQHQDQAQPSLNGSVKTPGFMQFFQSMFKQYQDQEAEALRQQVQQRQEAEAQRQKQEQQQREAEQLKQEQQRQEAEALRQKQEQQQREAEQLMQEQQRQEAEVLRQKQEQQQREAEFMQNMVALFQQQQMQGNHVFQGGENEERNEQHPLNDHHPDEDNLDNLNAEDVDDTHSGLIGNEGHALGAPNNLIGTKKAKAIRSLQVTHVPSAPRITIIETPTGRSQRTTGIPETGGKF
jgi:hypothetical protein